MAKQAKQKQVQTNFRTTPEMKKRLEAAAEVSGLTFNKEVNRRLAESFDPRRDLDPVLGDPVLFAMMIVVAKAMKKTGTVTLLFKDHTKNEREWHSDAYAYARAVDAAFEALHLMRPAGDADAGPQLDADQVKLGAAVAEMGQMNGRGEVRNITRRAPSHTTTRPDDLLREMLGEEVIKRFEANLEHLK